MRRPALAVFALTLILAACGRTPQAAEPATSGTFSALNTGVQELAPLNPVASALASSAPVNETTGLWFVELSGAPVADGGSLSSVRAEKQAFRAAARSARVAFVERYAFDTLFNGLSVRATPAGAATLSKLSGVKNVYPVARESIPPTAAGTDPSLFTALAMTGADVVQGELGYTGSGVKVAVMDTGVDYDHPDLGGGFGPGMRVAVGWDFVGNAYNADPASPGYDPNPKPDSLPDDCNGHGTHVAGIIGANGTVTGVAPDVTFGAYRVFGCEGSTDSDIMLAAMERVLADDMDVLNMSIGASYQWPQYPTAVAASRLVNKGVVVVASIGNSGANGLYAAGAPGVGEKVIGVASFDNTNVAQNAFLVQPGNFPIGYNAATGAPVPPTSGTYPISLPSIADGCTAASFAGFPAGSYALVQRGTCSFHIKVVNAQAAGATGVILYNNTAGALNPTVVGAAPITVPVAAITQADGVLIANTPSASITWQPGLTVSRPSSTGNLISAFSSYGLAPDLSLKPDIAAPGGNIYSTYVMEKANYASISGTSMASPHVAGAAALLLQAKPNTPPQAVRTILQNTASPKVWWGNPALGYLDQVQRQGAGMLQIDDAILATTKVEPSRLALGESQAGAAVRTLSIKNESTVAVTYTLSHSPALSTNPNTYTVAATTGFAGVTFSTPTVTVPAGGIGSITVTIAANPGLAERGLYGGYIVLTPSEGADTVRVPYVGMKGDYQSIVALKTTDDLTRLARYNPADAVNPFPKAEANPTYTLKDNDFPVIAYHLDHQVRTLRAEVIDAVSGRNWKTAYQEEFTGRNSTATSLYAFGVDGITVNGNKLNAVPDGTYFIKLSLLKPLGDNKNPAHWEYWTSPAFIIDRP